jgi:hypothetical protein
LWSWCNRSACRRGTPISAIDGTEGATTSTIAAAQAFLSGRGGPIGYVPFEPNRAGWSGNVDGQLPPYVALDDGAVLTPNRSNIHR